MQKKHKIIILIFILFTSASLCPQDDFKLHRKKPDWVGEPEKQLFNSCAHIFVEMYEQIVSDTAIHFIQEIDEDDNILELRLLKEIATGFYKVTVELVKYSKTTLFSKGPLLGKAKRVCAILTGFFLMQQTMNNLSDRQKLLKKYKTVSK
jgi:hypothetical protein